MYRIAKVVVVGLILIESTILYIRTDNYNDDLSSRPFLHGAYDVTLLQVNGELPDTHQKNLLLKRIFIHRHGYFITQSEGEVMHDYKLEIDQDNSLFLLEDHDGTNLQFSYKYSKENTTLSLEWFVGPDTIVLVANRISMKNLPIFQSEILWTVEDHLRK